MDNILRLIANKNFLVEPFWGLQQLTDIMAYQEVTKSNGEIFMKDRLLKSQQVDFFKQGQFVGSTLNDIKQGSIAKVSMSGMMTVEDGWCNYGMDSLDKQMRSLYNSSAVEAIILYVNSGGGYSDAGDVLLNTIADRNKPVLVHTVFMASAALKGTLKADEIIAASESTTVGSIGVMLSMPKWYVEEAKENEIELYSEKSPEKNSAWRALKEGNFEPYIKELTKLDDIFMNQVKQNRPLKGVQSTIDYTLSGATFTASEGKRRGLVDGIGSFNYALTRAQSHIKYNSK